MGVHSDAILIRKIKEKKANFERKKIEKYAEKDYLLCLNLQQVKLTFHRKIIKCIFVAISVNFNMFGIFLHIQKFLHQKWRLNWLLAML